MGDLQIMDLMSKGLFTVLTAAAGPLICGLLTGIIASIFQTVTSIQEPTLAFIPKIVAVMIALVVFGSFMGSVVLSFVTEVLDLIPALLSSTG